MIEMQVYGGRPISVELKVSIDVQLGGFELRVSVHPQLRPLRHGVEDVVTNQLMVKGQIAKPDIRVDRRLLQRARSLCGEIHAAIHRHTGSLKFPNARQVEVVSIQVEVKGMRRKVEGAAPCNVRVVIREMNIIQRKLIATELQLRVQMLYWFTVNHGIGELKPAASSWLLLRALHLHQQ